MELPSCKQTKQLRTKTYNVNDLDRHYEADNAKAIVDVTKLREVVEKEGKVDQYEKMQPPKPDADDKLTRIEI